MKNKKNKGKTLFHIKLKTKKLNIILKKTWFSIKIIYIKREREREIQKNVEFKNPWVNKTWFKIKT